MAPKPQDPAKRVSFQVSIRERPDFKQPLVAYVFDERGQLKERTEVLGDKLEPSLSAGELARARVFIAPRNEKLEAMEPTPALMERIGAYEPVLRAGGGRLIDRIDLPGPIIDHWPFCSCWVRGRVLRRSDNRAVCDARVHICEVDRIPLWIRSLPDPDVLRLRHDLLEMIRNPPIPWPIPDPGPFPPYPGPGPDPAPLSRPALRFHGESTLALQAGAARSVAKAFDPQPDPRVRGGLNPPPVPPRDRLALNPQPEPPGRSATAATAIQLPPEVQAGLRSTSTTVVRGILAENWRLIIPWLCIWPWWWWRFRCDEVAVLTTDARGRFETTIFYPCGGDHPDLYFWVEYDFGSGFETVYHPSIACNTYWDYPCGTEVTIRVTDPRVPGCEDEPDLPGCQVVVLSIGRGVAVREIQTSGATEGLTTSGEPFGATLEPRVDFSRTALIVDKDIPYYRWSYRRLSGPDGVTATVDASSVPIGAWSVMTRDVYRHYKFGTSYLSQLMGPLPTIGTDAAPLPNLFRIRPAPPPNGSEEWIVLDETVDLATAYFETGGLAGAPSGPAPDLAAGRYEMKLELFDAAGALVNWTTAGIDLRIPDKDAPFGTGTITTSKAPAYNQIMVGGHLMGFRMVVRVDNNRCHAEILPVGGTVTPDALCGFHFYNAPSDLAGLSFVARHPNHFARFWFVVERGTGPAIPAAATSGVAGEAATNGYNQGAPFTYAKDVTVSTLLGTCSNAAFSERLDVKAMATNGYSTLSGYNSSDNAAFALATPCEPCECEEGEEARAPLRRGPGR